MFDIFSPLASFFHVMYKTIGSSDYYLDPSTGKYFVEVPPEEDDDDFAQ